MSDTTGEKIIKARNDERARIMASRPTIKTEIGFSGATPLPTISIVLTGGNPDRLFDLGREIASAALTRLESLHETPTVQA